MYKIFIVLLVLCPYAFCEVDAVGYGFKPNDPSFDNTLKLDQFISSTGDNTLYLSCGQYYFNTKPKAIDRPLWIRGGNVNCVTLVRAYNPTDYNDALIHLKSASVIEGLAFHAGDGTHGGSAVKVDGLPSSHSRLSNLYITRAGNGNWDIGLIIYSEDALGVRGTYIDAVDIFASVIHGAWIVNAQGMVANFQVYPAGGFKGHIVIQAYNSYKSGLIQFMTRHLTEIWLYDVQGIKINTLGGTTVHNIRSANVREI